MTLAEYRQSLGLTLAQMAAGLELSEKSVGWMSEIENGKRDASLRLALRIERWSGGQVTAASVCRELADHGAAPVVDAGTLAASEDAGAGKSAAVFSPKGVAA